MSIKPITELEILRGMQEDIAGLDFGNPNAVECAIALGYAMGKQATRALDEMRGLSMTQAALLNICNDTLNTEEDAAMDAMPIPATRWTWAGDYPVTAEGQV